MLFAHFLDKFWNNVTPKVFFKIMKIFKVFQIILSFTKDEMNEFEDFIKSPYISGSRDYLPIVKGIYSLRHNVETIYEFTNEDFFHKIYPDKSYSNKTFRNRLTELTNIAKRYIVQKETDNDKLLNNMLILKGLKKRKLFNIFRSEYEKVNELVENDSKKSYNGAEIKMLSAYVYLEMQDYTRIFEEYKKWAEYFLTFFMENYFMIMIEFETEKRYGISSGNNMGYDLINSLNAESFINSLQQRKNNDYSMINMYYYLFKSISDISDEINYKKFRNIFFKNLDKLSVDQKNDFFGYMISRYFEKINSGKQEFLIEVFKLYNIKLKLGLYSELKIIRYPSTAFRDYIVVGLRLKRYKWVEEFIKKYSAELPAEIRDMEVNMAYTRLYLFKKEFNNALDYLNKMKTGNSLYILDASRLRLRIYYETLRFEDAILEVDRTKHYIRNNTNKIALSVRKYSKDFLDKYNELLKLRLSPDKKEIDYFAKKVRDSQSLVLKEWLLEKLKEMRGI